MPPTGSPSHHHCGAIPPGPPPAPSPGNPVDSGTPAVDRDGQEGGSEMEAVFIKLERTKGERVLDWDGNPVGKVAQIASEPHLLTPRSGWS